MLKLIFISNINAACDTKAFFYGVQNTWRTEISKGQKTQSIRLHGGHS